MKTISVITFFSAALFLGSCTGRSKPMTPEKQAAVDSEAKLRDTIPPDNTRVDSGTIMRKEATHDSAGSRPRP